jgi:hypothetical protein
MLYRESLSELISKLIGSVLSLVRWGVEFYILFKVASLLWRYE